MPSEGLQRQVKFRRNWISQHLFILRFKFGNVIHKVNIVDIFIVQKIKWLCGDMFSALEAHFVSESTEIVLLVEFQLTRLF